MNAAVDLTIDPGAASLVTGTVNGKPVHAKGSLYGTPHGGPATVTGSLSGHPLAAILTRHDQVPRGSGYVTTARLTASVGDTALVASGAFRLDANYLFVNGDITGTDRGLTIEVTAGPRSSSDGTGYAAKLQGEFGGVRVAIVATSHPIDLDRSSGQRAPTASTCTSMRIAGPRGSSRITGTYSGPTELLALIVGSIAYFVG